MKNKCVICDSEKDYAIGLMEYVNRKKTLPFDGIVCTSKESLFEYAVRNPIDLLLVAESMMEEEIGCIPAVVTIVLNEGLGLKNCLAYAQVYKYQSCETLFGDVMEAFGNTEHDALEFGSVKKNGTQRIGIYGFDDFGTAAALAAGQILAEKRKVLFLDITQFSALDLLYDMDKGRGLGDLLYYCGRKDFDLNARLSSVSCERFGMDLIPPLASPDDLFGIASEQWAALIAEITQKSVYDVVIINIGIPSFALMDLCRTVFVPVRGGEYESMRMEAFLRTLSQSRYREAREMIRTLDLEGQRGVSAAELKESPAGGRFGMIIRAALEKEGMI